MVTHRKYEAFSVTKIGNTLPPPLGGDPACTCDPISYTKLALDFVREVAAAAALTAP